jgi:hypothetical protein
MIIKDPHSRSMHPDQNLNVARSSTYRFDTLGTDARDIYGTPPRSSWKWSSFRVVRTHKDKG